MTEGDLLEHILERLCRADSGQEIFGAHEAARWPGGALEVLTKSGVLGRAEPTRVIECIGELDQAKLPNLLELKYRAVSDAAAQVGGVAQIRDAFIGF
jgi:hypothetical protein